jgi:hypothetical protein
MLICSLEWFDNIRVDVTNRPDFAHPVCRPTTKNVNNQADSKQHSHIYRAVINKLYNLLTDDDSRNKHTHISE